MNWLQKIVNFIATLFKPKPAPIPDAYLVRIGDRQERTLAVPCALEFAITGKQAGSAFREEVVAWAVSAGGDWQGGNPPLGIFSVRVHDSRPDWGKVKVYGTSGYSGEPPLRIAWAASETYTLRLAVEQGLVRVTVRRHSDGYTAQADQITQTPPLVTLGFGDPPKSSRKAAEGARISKVLWVGKP